MFAEFHLVFFRQQTIQSRFFPPSFGIWRSFLFEASVQTEISFIGFLCYRIKFPNSLSQLYPCSFVHRIHCVYNLHNRSVVNAFRTCKKVDLFIMRLVNFIIFRLPFWCHFKRKLQEDTCFITNCGGIISLFVIPNKLSSPLRGDNQVVYTLHFLFREKAEYKGLIRLCVKTLQFCL